MPQVQLNTRISIETYTELKQHSEATSKPIARIVEEALINYLKEESPMTNLKNQFNEKYPTECNGVLCWWTDATTDYYTDTPENRKKLVTEFEDEMKNIETE